MSHKSDDSSDASGSCSHKKSSGQCNQCYGGKLQYKENCGPKVCSLPCDGVNPYALYVKKRSAVVRIFAQTTLTTLTDPCARVCDNHACPTPCPQLQPQCPSESPFSFNNNIGLLQQYSNGFFVNNHLIVAPASIALLSPDITTIYNRYPFSANQIDPTLLHGDRITRAASFTADVFDVNGTGRTLNYALEFLGVYGLGDVALFYINREGVNKKLLCIKKCHPFFQIACSRDYRSGLPVYSFGDAGARSWPARPVAVPAGGALGEQATIPSALEAVSGANNFLQGTVQDIRYVDYGGFAQQELVLVSLPIGAFKTGLPLLNQWGQVIGMQTTTDAVNSPNLTAAVTQALPQILPPNGDGFVAGPSSFFFGRVIHHFYETLRGSVSPFVQAVSDDFGNYLLFTHGYLGVSSEVFTGDMYSSYVNAAGLVVPRYNLDGVLANVGPREIIGLRVRALAGAPGGPDIAPAGVVVPGPSTVGTVAFTPSPLAGTITYNDVLVTIDKQPLGDLKRQIALSVMTSRRLPGEAVEIWYRKQCEDYKKTHSVRAILQTLPNFMNYPWYKYPTLTTALRDLQPLNGANFLSLLPVVPPVSGLTSFLPAV